MASAPAPPKTPPKAPPPAKAAEPERTRTTGFATSRGIRKQGQKIVLYGPGGIGKTELAANLGQLGLNVTFLDVEGSTNSYDVSRVTEIDETASWQDLRDALHCEDLWKGTNAIVLDTATKAEELAIYHTLLNVTHEKGHFVKSIEGYGFGKGFVHVYETFLLILGDLDWHIRQGRTVIVICHDCTTNVPNPAGEDWIRWEPRLQSPASGKASIRHRVKEWSDHTLFIGYDVHAKDGKAMGGGSRTIYPVEMPTHIAKSRKLSSPIVYERGDAELWRQLFGK